MVFGVGGSAIKDILGGLEGREGGDRGEGVVEAEVVEVVWGHEALEGGPDEGGESVDVKDRFVGEFALADADIVKEGGVGIESVGAGVFLGDDVDELGPEVGEKVIEAMGHEVEVDRGEVQEET